MPDHLTREELTLWRDDGAGDRVRIVAHLAACAACREVAAAVERDRPADTGAPRFDSGDFAASGYRIGPPAVGQRSVGPWIWLAGSAALVALALIPVWRARIGVSPGAMRGAAAPVVLVQPVDAGVAADALTFEWRGTAAGDRVRLNVVDLDNAGEPLIEHEITGTRYDPTPEERRRFRSGQSVHWYVEVLGGANAGTSPAARFRVR